MPLVSSGVENGNLRELALQRMKDFGTVCRDVRNREVGVHEIHHKVRPDEVELIRRDYTANGGWETFLSYEDPEADILVGLLRLRKCSKEGTFRQELLKDGQTSMVRELHGASDAPPRARLSVTHRMTFTVYGTAVPMHSRDPTKVSGLPNKSLQPSTDVSGQLVPTSRIRNAPHGRGRAYSTGRTRQSKVCILVSREL